MDSRKADRGRKIRRFVFDNKAFFLMIIFAVVLSFGSPAFLSKRNILNVLRQICVSAIISIGFTMLLGSGHMDLSCGSILGLCGMLVGYMMVYMNIPVGISIIMTIIAGVICGIFNAALISYLRLPPFLVTMGSQQIFRGFVYLITNSKPITDLPSFFGFIGQGFLFGIPFPIYVVVVLTILVYILANYTRIGRYVLAIGGNIEAARVSGINVIGVRFFVYGLQGACAAIAGIVATGRVASSQPSAGVGMEMEAIAAVVIGGTSMKGGRGAAQEALR